MKKNIILSSLLPTLMLTTFANAETLALWPSDICVAKANGGATVAVTDTRRIAVTATPDAAWPGAAVNFAGGP
ncbi:MAG: hypothetical protein FWG50_12130, partial [Kiritimatiellaeota bacterium]|nr:hypothetical protein [Kiritimatiellota bacterium]